MQLTADKLGSIVMIELRDSIMVPRHTLEQIWHSLGLPPQLIPQGRSTKDAFRKATPRRKASKGLHLEPYTGPALKAEGLEMAVVMTHLGDDDAAIRRLHTNCIVVGLTPQGQLRVIQDRPATAAEQAYLTRIETIFHEASNKTIDGTLIRAAVKRVAEEARAFTIKGGVYMFPETTAQTASALVELADQLTPFVRGNFAPNETLVVAYNDTPMQRQQLKEKLDLYIKETVSQELSAIYAYAQRSHKPLSERKKESTLVSLGKLGVMISEYETVLGDTLDQLRTYHLQQQAFFKQELDRL